jgi:hypothetical protein
MKHVCARMAVNNTIRLVFLVEVQQRSLPNPMLNDVGIEGVCIAKHDGILPCTATNKLLAMTAKFIVINSCC